MSEPLPDVSDARCDAITLDGETYMRRWYPIPGMRFRYHEILRSDPDRHFHDHPWHYTSKLLHGSYVEITPTGEHEYKAGDVLRRDADELHRLVLPSGPVWTEVRTSRVLRTWGFATDDGWVPWHVYRAAGERVSVDRPALSPRAAFEQRRRQLDDYKRAHGYP